MVKPIGKVVRDYEVTSRDLSFKSVWRELKENGWTRKPPPRHSLDDRYFYVRPGVSQKGTEGVHFFRGEEDVLEYYANALRNGTRAPVTTTSHTASGGTQLGDAHRAAAAAVLRDNYAADIERAEATAQAASNEANLTSAQVTAIPTGATQVGEAQVATSTETSQRHTHSDIRSKGKTKARRSLARNSNAMTSTPPRHPCARTILVTSPHIQDSNGSASDDTATADNDSAESLYVPSGSEHDGDNDDQVEEGTLGSELLADSGDALNVVADGDMAAHFGMMESGDEAEKDDVETGEYGSDEDPDILCIPEDTADDPDPTEQEIAAEVMFAEDFLSQFGGEDAVLAGNLQNGVLREMSVSGWEDVTEPDTYDYLMTPYEPVSNTGSYPGLRQ
ncbi:hypothetical protein F441_04597 [Phytophthora nicotianae CJ01A1]|uniref:Uncharacterized protein n=2 Tax=Phytophthora nicotianae TaxID=4792 RepID=W2XGI2_PHYNI|nr:hypothetical protein L915_14392 [Phytophthora nicotianae]ETP22005.1 hypothetical protein F441_04597 [Phytophthora nicotianae CJ01A1]